MFVLHLKVTVFRSVKSCAYFSGSRLLGDNGCVEIILCASSFEHIQLVYDKNISAS
jgi:hypothetical protein